MTIVREQYLAARAATSRARFVSFNPASIAEALSHTSSWRRTGIPEVYEGLAMLCVVDQIEPVIVSQTVLANYPLYDWYQVYSGAQRTCLKALSHDDAVAVGEALFGVTSGVNVVLFDGTPAEIMEFLG